MGAFLAGLAVNEAAQNRPATEKLGFLANSMFIPFFFLVTGFLIDPAVFVRSVIDHFGLAVSLVLAVLIGKGIAAETTGRAFKYSRDTRMTVWSLTLPQVAATLAATLVGYKTLDPAGRPLIDDRVLNSVFVLMVSTSILGRSSPNATHRGCLRSNPRRKPSLPPESLNQASNRILQLRVVLRNQIVIMSNKSAKHGRRRASSAGRYAES